jgi:hypothetical protein
VRSERCDWRGRGHRDHCHVSEAVGCAAAEQLVALLGQLERVAVPRLRVGRHDVQVTADDRDRPLRGGGGVVFDHQVGAVLSVDVRLHLAQTEAVMLFCRTPLCDYMDSL